MRQIRFRRGGAPPWTGWGARHNAPSLFPTRSTPTVSRSLVFGLALSPPYNSKF